MRLKIRYRYSAVVNSMTVNMYEIMSDEIKDEFIQK